MSYKIRYDQQMVIEPIRENARNRISVKPIFAIIFIVLLMFFVSKYKDTICDYLIPGNKTVTANAFDNLVDEMKSGEPLDAAVVAFCKEIFDNAQTQIS